ncbi:MAG: alpha/beta fold hydrolase [Myxococcales bacterium]|nr:alpha/beta fold hydrolase [Myxococcales bacterium]
MTTVVLVHSFPLDASMWAPQIAALEAFGVRVLAPNLPGFGDAPLPRDTDPSLDVYVDALLARLDAEGIARAVFVGLSLGGYVVLRLAARALSRVEGLVLCDTRAGGDAPTVRAARVVNLALVRSRGSLGLIEKLLPGLVAPETGEAVRQTLVTMAARQSPEAVSFALLAMRDRPDATPTLGALRVPALVMVGAHDAITPPDEHQRLAEALPDAAWVVLDGAGHMSNLEQPEAFNDALVRYLEALTGRPSN